MQVVMIECFLLNLENKISRRSVLSSLRKHKNCLIPTHSIPKK